MKIGDQVLYLQNEPIDLDRDLGVIEDFTEDGDPVVLYADGFRGVQDLEDLRRVKGSQSRPMHHGYFGCLQDPCPVHNSTSSDQE
jgi:hypothetical protein